MNLEAEKVERDSPLVKHTDSVWTGREELEDVCTLVATDDYVILRQEPASEQVKGIHLPGQVAQKARPRRGVVIAVGDGVYVHSPDGKGLPTRVPLDSRRGDLVYFSEFTGIVFHHEEVEYVALKESDIFAKVQVEGDLTLDLSLLEKSRSGQETP